MMTTEPIVAVIGEALMDVVDTGDGATFTAHVGGSPLNVATGLARLGQPTAFLGRFSNDSLGRILRRYAERAGLDLDASPNATEPSTLAVVRLDHRGVASYDFTVDGTADWAWTSEELARLPASVTVLHLGSLTSWLPPGAEVVGTFVDRLHAAGQTLISYDPNVRPGLLGDPAAAKPIIEARIRSAHIVKASAEDVDWLYLGNPPADVAASWLALGARLVTITQGGDGATTYSSTATVTRPALPVTIVDTVGAGDAFTSGLLDGLLTAGARIPADLDRVLADTALLGHVLDRAVVVSGLTCSRAGANPPTREEVDRLMASG
jgi:fructokinase